MPLRNLSGEGMGIVPYLRQRKRNDGNWNPEDDQQWREWVALANDGIISSAAIIQGLLSGGATGHEALIGVLALVSIGMFASAVAEYSEAESQYLADQRVYKAGQRALMRPPEEQVQELARILVNKGLSPKLSEAAAEELYAKAALRRELGEEGELEEPHDKLWPVRRGLTAAGAFLLGSLLPLVFLLLLPRSVRGEVTVVAVVAALAVSGWFGHLAEHTSAWRAMLRTILTGLVILGISTLAGSLVSF